jgi:hypothetical protein
VQYSSQRCPAAVRRVVSNLARQSLVREGSRGAELAFRSFCGKLFRKTRQHFHEQLCGTNECVADAPIINGMTVAGSRAAHEFSSRCGGRPWFVKMLALLFKG